MKESTIIAHLERLAKEVRKITTGNVAHQRNYVASELEMFAIKLEKEGIEK